jgi:hypothetical protein
MQRQVANALSKELLNDRVQDGDHVQIDLADDEERLTFETPSAARPDAVSGDGAPAVGTG